MADEVLSQAEVESLLSSMESQGPRAASGGAPSSTSAGNAASAGTATSPGAAGSTKPITRAREKISSYDFKRPERVGKEQMRALQSLHEGFGRNFGAALSALLRAIVEVKLTSVDQLTYSEFVFSLENPTCFSLITAEPLEGRLILDINPSILYPIIDRLLGGGKDTGPISRRPLTEIELRLVGRITSLFLQELKHAWENVLTLSLEVERVESNPQLVQIVPPNEVVVLISFELTLGDLRGMINLCIPFNSIERISSKLAANSWATYGKTASTPTTKAAMGRRLEEAQLEVIVTLAESTITTKDLIGLRVGDIITTDKDVHEPLDVAVQGASKFNASVGAFKGRKAIRVETQPQ
jgi:flagellar motor switch protein FliM